MSTFPLAGEPLLCRFLLPRCGSSFPESAKRASRHLQGPEPQDYSAPLREQGKRLAAFVLQRSSSLWLSFSVGKLLIKSKLDPFYVMAKLDGRA